MQNLVVFLLLLFFIFIFFCCFGGGGSSETDREEVRESLDADRGGTVGQAREGGGEGERGSSHQQTQRDREREWASLVVKRPSVYSITLIK